MVPQLSARLGCTRNVGFRGGRHGRMSRADARRCAMSVVRNVGFRGGRHGQMPHAIARRLVCGACARRRVCTCCKNVGFLGKEAVRIGIPMN